MIIFVKKNVGLAKKTSWYPKLDNLVPFPTLPLFSKPLHFDLKLRVGVA